MINLISKDKIVKEELLDLTDCEEIILSFSVEDIDISLTDDDKLKVVQIASEDFKKEEEFISTRTEKGIEIKLGNKNKKLKVSNGRISRNLIVSIPKSYRGSLEVKNSLGYISINDNLKLEKINIIQSTGSFKCNNFIEVNDINIKNSLGNIIINEVVSTTYNIETSTGKVKIKSLDGSGNITSSLGNLEVYYKDIKEFSTIKSSTGSVKIFVPKELSFEFWAQCITGKIKSSFDINYKTPNGRKATVLVGNGPYKKLNVNTSLGSIYLNEK